MSSSTLINAFAYQKKLETPVYVVERTREGLLKATCTFLDYETIGYGTNKRVSKNQAADLMWQKLLEQYPTLDTGVIDDSNSPSPSHNKSEVNPIELKQELHNLGFTYTLYIFQMEPLVLKLVGQNGVILFSAKREIEASVEDILNLAVKMAKAEVEVI
ncbi:uncharacterized protein LOC109608798 [Aethina tumida]|uniref:uncharacterized protein LOC109608798 n=1 Tax=Aethina tumida TaxID=116153 RepID=UPI00096B6202|nr:uncharacterized protein LOC109608798 [Aethina tumida]